MLPPKAIKYYQTHPIEFCTNHLNMIPDQNQRPILRAIAKGKNISVRSGHGTGKSAVLSAALIWFLYTKPFCRIPCTAPTKHQLYDILWTEAAKWLRKSNINNDITWTATKISMKGYENEWFAIARTAREPEGLSGFHADDILYLIDEASAVPENIFEVIDGSMSTENAQMITIGNPTRITGRFYESHHNLRDIYDCHTINCLDSSRVSKDYILQMRRKWGETSDIYRVRVLGDFPRMDPDVFIQLDKVENAVGRDGILPTGDLEIGVDVARFGQDASSLSAKRGLYIHSIRKWSFCDTQVSAGKVSAGIRDVCGDIGYRGKVKVRVDDIGVGGGVLDALIHMDKNVHPWLQNCSFIGVNFGGKGDDFYANVGTKAWGTIRESLDMMHLPQTNYDLGYDSEELIGQLSTRRAKTQPTGRIILESKDDMKRRGISSPDIADALALSFAAEELPELHVY